MGVYDMHRAIYLATRMRIRREGELERDLDDDCFGIRKRCLMLFGPDPRGARQIIDEKDQDLLDPQFDLPSAIPW
jgi:hypothetical protein